MKEYTVKEFLRLPVTSKCKLQKRDPEQYDRLSKAVNKNYNKESDPEAARELLKNVKSKK